jgi:hypothetical protein
LGLNILPAISEANRNVLVFLSGGLLAVGAVLVVFLLFILIRSTNTSALLAEAGMGWSLLNTLV